MGKASRRKQAIKRLIELDQAQVRPGAITDPTPTGLPLDYVDLLRVGNRAIFKFAEVDLARMRQTGEIPEQIFDPVGDCAENAYVEGYIENARRRPEINPWLYDRAALKAAVLHVLREYRSLVSFLHGGSKTYFFSDGLSESLSYTALNMPARDLKLPVPGFVFVFRSEAATEAFHAISKTPHDGVNTITVFVRDDTLEQVGFRRLLIVAYEHGDTLGKVYSGVSRQLAMKDDWDLEQALNTDWDKPGMRPDEGDISTGWKTTPDGDIVAEEELPEHFLNDQLRFTRMVLNGILYITSRGAEITEKLAGRPIHSGGHRAPNPGFDPQHSRTYSVVGESIKQIPVVIDPTVSYDPLATAAGKRTLRKRFLVPGFWRRPPNSPPDAKKDVWVNAFYKGPEMADLVNKPYIVR
ncbi:hypothetical protein [Burkholderia sp. Ac-20365]|uniref:hypothetical protein n=1 Tax=Burkholderia sp. Ac-20365 TaxID=2703897 RepID=UPI00197B3336|nr:hypothetical protein [Burkholderia sp. Ac-20365]MBN3761022.1 hypothetical protein [Burkholderia sp. Ac-20365]